MEKVILDAGYNRLKYTRHGYMLFNRNDLGVGKSLDLYGEWTWEELRLTMPYASGIVIDAGAHIGTHTIPYARVAKQVIAYEPQLHIWQNLVANCALNCAQNVIPHLCAIGDKRGIIQIEDLNPHLEMAFCGLSLGTGPLNVPIGTIDELELSSQVTLIKMDIEGMELEALEGAKETIHKYKPLLYVENNRESKFTTMIDMIEDMGYKCFVHKLPEYNPHNFFQNPVNVFGEEYVLNMICFPNSYKIPEHIFVLQDQEPSYSMI